MSNIADTMKLHRGRFISIIARKRGVEKGGVVYGDSVDYVVGIVGFRYDNLVRRSLDCLRDLDPVEVSEALNKRGYRGYVRDWTRTSPIYKDREALLRIAREEMGLEIPEDAGITKIRAALKEAGPREVPLDKDVVRAAIASLERDLEGSLLANALRKIRGDILKGCEEGDEAGVDKAIRALKERAFQEGVPLSEDLLDQIKEAKTQSDFDNIWDEIKTCFQHWGRTAVDVNEKVYGPLLDEDGDPVRGARVYIKEWTVRNPNDEALEDWLRKPIPGSINIQTLIVARREIEPPTVGPIPPSVSSPLAAAKRGIRYMLPIGRYRSYRLIPQVVAVKDRDGYARWRETSMVGGQVVDHLEPGDTYILRDQGPIRRGGEWALKVGSQAITATEQVEAEGPLISQVDIEELLKL